MNLSETENSLTVIELIEIINQQTVLIEKKDEKIKNQSSLIEALEYKLKLKLIENFGRKSEKLNSHQLGLFDEALLSVTEAVQDESDLESTVTIPKHTRKKRGRKKLPENLPRETIEHDLTEGEKTCDCGNPLHCMGHDKAEQLEYVPARYKVIEHITYKYACAACEAGVKSAKRPKPLLPKSIVTPGLASHVIVSKFCDHLPLYRQEKIFLRKRINLARGTLGDWIVKLSQLCSPLLQAHKKFIIESSYVQADETPVQILKLPDKQKPHQGYMWVARGGPPLQKAILYEFHSSRSGESARKFLDGFCGKLQTDAYQAYAQFEVGNQVKRFGCMAHARRKFMDIVKTNKQEGIAFKVVQTIRSLYQLESELRETEFTFDERYQLRQKKALPIIKQLKSDLDQHQLNVPPQSPIGKAIAYTLNHWPSLIHYLTDGEVEIDNNLIENAIRPFALGRRNWLFIGNESGAKASALFYSLIETCRIHKIEPYVYLKHLFSEIPTINLNDQAVLQALLPQCIDRSLLETS